MHSLNDYPQRVPQDTEKNKTGKLKQCLEVPWWLRGLMIQGCPFCCRMGLIPGLGTSACCRCDQK